MDYAPSGDLSGFSAVEISDAAEWDGEPELFVRALKGCGLVDEDGKIHDWMEYAGRLVARRENDYQRKKELRKVSKEMADGHLTDKVRTTAGCPQDVRTDNVRTTAECPQDVRTDNVRMSVECPQDVRTDSVVPYPTYPTLPNPTQPVVVDLLKRSDGHGGPTTTAAEGVKEGGKGEGGEAPGPGSGCTPTFEEVKGSAMVVGIPEEVCRKFFDSRETVSWKNRRGLVMSAREWWADLRSYWATWRANEAEKKAVASAKGQAGGLSPVAARLGAESRKKALEELLERHPANPESASAVDEPTLAQREDYREKKKMVRELREQLAKGVF